MSGPMVSRSVQAGTCRVKITVPRPILAPSARRYHVYSGEPTATKTRGFDLTSVLTTQKRKYPRLQTRICWGFHLPMSTHLARIGRMHRTMKAAPPKTTDLR